MRRRDYQKLWEFSDRSQFDFKETVFWTVDDGFGSTTALNYARLLGPSLALRWQSAATWSQETEGVLWSSSLGMYRSFGFQRQFSLEALVNGESGLGVGVVEYGVRARWEQSVYHDWLLLEVILGHFWPRADEYSPRTNAWAAGAGLQMRF